MNYQKTLERYANDVVFHQVVDMLYHLAATEGWTPQEMRDTADFASLKWAQEHVEPIYLRSLLSRNKKEFKKEMLGTFDDDPNRLF